MFRKLVTTLFALLVALPALPRARQGQAPIAEAHPVAEAHPALHLMNNGEFALFLRRLDMGASHWKAQLRNVDVKSLRLDHHESEELERSYGLCLQSIDNTREEIQKLSQKQTLKLDFLLLVDLNDLARNLDGLNRDLADPLTAGRTRTAQKSLGYAREVLGIDAALTPHVAEFQHHVLAFAEVIDDAMDRTGQDADPAPGQK